MLCFGHRGAMGYEPENTLRSIRRGIELGAQWIEIDVYFVCGRLVVIHDDTFERTTNGKGALAACTIDYLRSLDAGAGEAIPFLEEVIETVANRAGLNIELKGPGTGVPVAEFLSNLIGEGAYTNYLLSSFELAELSDAQSVNPSIPLGLLAHDKGAAAVRAAFELGAVSIHPNRNIVDRELIELAHAHGLKIIPYTVNDAREIARLRSLGVDGIFCDFPDRVFREEL